jgi:hypothetical protein
MIGVHLTLYYDTLARACEAGFPDAVAVDEDDPNTQYMAIASFEADNYEASHESCLDLEINLEELVA